MEKHQASSTIIDITTAIKAKSKTQKGVKEIVPTIMGCRIRMLVGREGDTIFAMIVTIKKK